MSYIGDFTEDYATLNLKFTTRKSTGEPFTLAGTPVISIYKNNSLVQTTTGITLTIDFDGVTGLNNVLVDLSSDAFYAITADYDMIITVGTVDTVSVVGEVIGEFSIENRFDHDTAKATALATAQTDLNTITGSDGVTLATAQALYAPSKAGDSMDMLSISGDSVAADNLEKTYDGTGYTDDEAPATQEQIGRLATGSTAISVIAESRVLTTGTEVNTYTDTFTLNGIRHEITDVGGVIDLYYQFDVTEHGTAVEVRMTGRLVGPNDDMGIYAWNWIGSVWDQIGNLEGSSSSTDSDRVFNLLNSHTGTGGNLSKVRIRGVGTGLTSSTLYLDWAFVSFSVTNQAEIDAILVDTDVTIPALINGLNDPTTAAIAAAVSAFDMGNGRTIKEALSFLRNKWTLVGTTLTVYDTDDTTILWTSTVVKTAGDPVSSSDPV